MKFFPHHLGDYARNTAGLAQGEDGAYRLLMDTAYATESGIPEDEVYTVSKATNGAERRNTDKVLRKYWTLRDGHYYQKRIEEEIAEYRDKSAKAAANANKRWKKRDANADAKADATAYANADANAHANADAGAMLSSSQQPVTSKQQQQLRARDASPGLQRERQRLLLIHEWKPDPETVERIAREVRSDIAVGVVYEKFYKHHLALGSTKTPKFWRTAWGEWCGGELTGKRNRKRKGNGTGSDANAHTGESAEDFESRRRTTRPET